MRQGFKPLSYRAKKPVTSQKSVDTGSLGLNPCRTVLKNQSSKNQP
jgi:hypothetical protein